jgi:hypothetical protein
VLFRFFYFFFGFRFLLFFCFLPGALSKMFHFFLSGVSVVLITIHERVKQTMGSWGGWMLPPSRRTFCVSDMSLYMFVYHSAFSILLYICVHIYL